MARIDNNKRLNSFLSDPDNFEAVAYDAPRAVAQRAATAKAFQRRETARRRNEADSRETASSFRIGQIVRHAKRPFDRQGEIKGEVIGVDGGQVSIRRENGTENTYNASFLVAA